MTTRLVCFRLHDIPVTVSKVSCRYIVVPALPTFRLRKAIARCKHESRGRTWELVVVVTATDRIDTLIARWTR